MRRDLTVEGFLEMARRLEGKRLTTPVRGAEFQVRSLPGGLVITPESTGRSRSVPVARIRRFLEEYGSSVETRPGHYHDITFDASYLLAILSRAETEVP
jgi:hypothetical protein